MAWSWKLAALWLSLLGLAAAGFWGYGERSERKGREVDNAALQGRLNALNADLERVTGEGRETAAALARVRDDLETQRTRSIQETNEYRARTDRLLAGLAEQQKALKETQADLELHRGRAQDLDAALASEQVRRQKTEAQLSAERSALQSSLDATRREAEKAQALARKQDEALKKELAEGDELEKRAKTAEGQLQDADVKNRKLANDLQRTANERDWTSLSNQQLQQMLAALDRELAARSQETRVLNHQLARAVQDTAAARAESHRLAQENARLSASVAALKAEVDRLTRLIGKQPGTREAGAPLPNQGVKVAGP